MSLVLVRHAWAGHRSEWHGDDRLRPLDARGREQAIRLPSLLDGIPVRRIVSSPYVRCIQTVEPLARERGLEVEIAEELGQERQDTDAPAFLRSLLADDAVACVHGGIEHVLGIDRKLPKGGVWLFEDSLDEPRVLGKA